ncbi:hypothetical protein [Amycolatopsis anabasis]|uniref:hypothetical protein n=1 Tax=Amycolatopsis anabasis TaxID=1840409 RepID=UPI00131E3D9E|nr:hypothetical protein [Amycolatopsis anabasis]
MAKKFGKRRKPGAGDPGDDPRDLFGTPQLPRHAGPPASSTPLADYLSRGWPGVDAGYVVLPRSLAESMPLPWQQQLTGLLAQFHEVHGRLSWPIYRVVPSRYEKLVDLDEEQLAEAGYLVEIDTEGEMVYRERSGRRVEDPRNTTVLVSCLDPIPRQGPGQRPPAGPPPPSREPDRPRPPAPMNIGPQPVWRSTPTPPPRSAQFLEPPTQGEAAPPPTPARPPVPPAHAAAPEPPVAPGPPAPADSARPPEPPARAEPGPVVSAEPPAPEPPAEPAPPPEPPSRTEPVPAPPPEPPPRAEAPPPPVRAESERPPVPPEPVRPPQPAQPETPLGPAAAAEPGQPPEPPKRPSDVLKPPESPSAPGMSRLSRALGPEPAEPPKPPMPPSASEWVSKPPANQPDTDTPPRGTPAPDTGKPRGWFDDFTDQEPEKPAENGGFGPTGEPTEIPYRYRP